MLLPKDYAISKPPLGRVEFQLTMSGESYFPERALSIEYEPDEGMIGLTGNNPIARLRAKRAQRRFRAMEQVEDGWPKHNNSREAY